MFTKVESLLSVYLPSGCCVLALFGTRHNDKRIGLLIWRIVFKPFPIPKRNKIRRFILSERAAVTQVWRNQGNTCLKLRAVSKISMVQFSITSFLKLPKFLKRLFETPQEMPSKVGASCLSERWTGAICSNQELFQTIPKKPLAKYSYFWLQNSHSAQAKPRQVISMPNCFY